MKPLDEITVLVTGSTDGIGKLTALNMAKAKARVLVHGRNKEKVISATEEIKKLRAIKMLKGLLPIFHLWQK
jgi:short-subunit dehydrogenase